MAVSPADTPAGEMLSNFADNLRHLCGYYPSVSHVCRALGINRTQFNRYLAAQVRPSPHLLNRLCDYFGVDAGEIHLPPSHFSRLVALKRKTTTTRPVYADQIEALQKFARPDMRKYLGYFHEYYFSMSTPGKILRGIVHIFEVENGVYFRRIEHFPHERHGGHSFKCRYVGVAHFLEDRIFLIDTETLTGNEITETILFPTRRNKVGRLTGLTLGVSSGDQRRIACSRVLLEWLGHDVDLRKALRSCGLFDPDAPEIDPTIRDLIDNRGAGDAPLFYALSL